MAKRKTKTKSRRGTRANKTMHLGGSYPIRGVGRMGGGSAPYFITIQPDIVMQQKKEPTTSLDWVKGEKMPEDVKHVRIQKLTGAPKMQPAGRVVPRNTTKVSSKAVPSLQRPSSMDIIPLEEGPQPMSVEMYPRNRNVDIVVPAQVGKSVTPATKIIGGVRAPSSKRQGGGQLGSLSMMDVDNEEPPSPLEVARVSTAAEPLPMMQVAGIQRRFLPQPRQLPSITRETKEAAPIKYGYKEPAPPREPAAQVAGPILPQLAPPPGLAKQGAEPGQVRRRGDKSFGGITAMKEPQTESISEFGPRKVQPAKKRIQPVEEASDPFDTLFEAKQTFADANFTFSSGVQLPPAQTQQAVWGKKPLLGGFTQREVDLRKYHITEPWPEPDLPQREIAARQPWPVAELPPTADVGVDLPAHKLTGSIDVDNLGDMRIKRAHHEVTKDVIRKEIKRPEKRTRVHRRQIELDGKTVWV